MKEAAPSCHRFCISDLFVNEECSIEAIKVVVNVMYSVR